MRLLIIGPQGSGKGTQAERLAASLGIVHVSTGDLFRSNVSQGTELGRIAKEIMDAGDLVPDEITVQMLEERISQPDAANGFILDGFPRNETQADALDGLLGDEPLQRVIVLEVPKDELIKRMLARGRSDDTEEAIATRLALYEEGTAPLIDRYRDRGLVIRVDGTGAIEDITERVLEAIKP